MVAIRSIVLSSSVDQAQQILALQKQVEDLQYSLMALKNAKSEGVFIKTGNMSRYITVASVVMIEARSNYTYIYLQDGTKIFAAKTVKHWENQFDSDSLIRIHKSYLVNKHHISYVCKTSHIVTMQGNLKAYYSRRLKNVIF